MKVVRIEKEGNPNFPLPANYADILKRNSQAAAFFRFNALCQWNLEDLSPEKKAEYFNDCLRFLDTFYLQNPQGRFYPPGEFRRSPEFHNDILQSLILYKYTAVAAPRGHAKSYLMLKICLLILLTCVDFEITYMTATARLVKRFFTKLIRTLAHNELLKSDYERFYSKPIKPTRGDGAWSSQGLLQLSNGAVITGSSPGSTNRGDRPNLMIVDDIEDDYEDTTDSQKARDDVLETIFRVIIPMVSMGDRKLLWIGTLISRRHVLTGVMSDDNNDSEFRDRRFDHWSRLSFKARYELPSGGFEILWPDLYTEKRLKEIEQEVGSDIFRAEYLNEPGHEGDKSFFLDEKKHAYQLDDLDAFTAANPLLSESNITYFDRKFEKRTLPLKDFLNNSLRFITVDWALSVGPSSDFSVATVMCLTPHNELFVLDLFVGRVTLSDLTTQIMRLVDKWRISIVGVEAPSVHGELMHLVRTAMDNYAEANGRKPKLIKIPQHKGMAKERYIEGLMWRFGDRNDEKSPGYIKLPFFNRSKSPWRQLFQQIQDFSPLVKGGGLEHDDILETISMSHRVIPGKPILRPSDITGEETEWDRMLAGEFTDPTTGDSYLSGADLLRINPEALQKLLDIAREKHYDHKETNYGKDPLNPRSRF
jgi:hypothetical protein